MFKKIEREIEHMESDFMMHDPDPRIVLAKWIGWSEGYFDANPNHGKCWIDPNGKEQCILPDTANNAADCESLIRKLNEEGWRVNVNFEGREHAVKVWRYKAPTTKEYVWFGANWKAGVVELAMKIVATEEPNKDD